LRRPRCSEPSKAICAASLCEMPSLRRGRRPHHARKERVGFIGAAPSSGVRRAMRKVASLAMRRHRGFAQRSHSARQLASSSGTRSTGSLTKRLQERRRRMIARLADRGKRIVWKVERSSHCLKAGGTSRRAEFPPAAVRRRQSGRPARRRRRRQGTCGVLSLDDLVSPVEDHQLECRRLLKREIRRLSPLRILRVIGGSS